MKRYFIFLRNRHIRFLRAQKSLISVALVILILLLAGCGGECKKDVDCDDGKDCTTDKCVKKKCEFSPIPDCTCGNNECEENKGETKCTCAKDCGRCRGKVGDYLENSCDGDECVTDVIEQKATVETDTIDDQVSRETQVKMIVTYTYDQPFNLDKSLLNAKYSLDTKLRSDTSKTQS